MKSTHSDLQKIDNLIKKSKRILIIPHRSPDGDTLGTSLALYQIFTNMNKEVDVICKDLAPEVFSFLPNIEKLKSEELKLDYDAYFIVDAGATHLTGFHEDYPELFNKSLDVVNIDHHQSNNYFGKYNIVEKTTASATMVLYKILMNLEYHIDRQTATCLLTGIYTDTGSFMHSNTSSEVLRVASRLMAKGADLRSISKEIFNTTKISTMRLWGRVMRSTVKTPEGITMAVVKKKDFEDTGSMYSDMSGVVDFINSVPNSQYSVILTERDNKVKGSLRTLKDEIDVADIASNYGGGGHTKAAGFTIPGKLEKEIRWKVVDRN